MPRISHLDDDGTRVVSEDDGYRGSPAMWSIYSEANSLADSCGIEGNDNAGLKAPPPGNGTGPPEPLPGDRVGLPAAGGARRTSHENAKPTGNGEIKNHSSTNIDRDSNSNSTNTNTNTNTNELNDSNSIDLNHGDSKQKDGGLLRPIPKDLRNFLDVPKGGYWEIRSGDSSDSKAAVTETRLSSLMYDGVKTSRIRKTTTRYGCETATASTSATTKARKTKRGKKRGTKRSYSRAETAWKRGNWCFLDDAKENSRTIRSSIHTQPLRNIEIEGSTSSRWHYNRKRTARKSNALTAAATTSTTASTTASTAASTIGSRLQANAVPAIPKRHKPSPPSRSNGNIQSSPGSTRLQHLAKKAKTSSSAAPNAAMSALENDAPAATASESSEAVRITLSESKPPALKPRETGDIGNRCVLPGNSALGTSLAGGPACQTQRQTQGQAYEQTEGQTCEQIQRQAKYDALQEAMDRAMEHYGQDWDGETILV